VFPPEVRVTGVDASRTSLDANARLDERVHADLEDYEVPERAYDCVVCWEVLEHLENPEPVVARLARAVADGGLLVIGSPNPRSIKGLVTRLTPHAFHLWVYRHFATDPPSDPFTTFMKAGGGSDAVRRVAEAAGLRMIYLGFAESPLQVALRERVRLTGRLWRSVAGLIRRMSLRHVEPEATDYVCVFERG
jgi:SAM-dependent methyltransferase